MKPRRTKALRITEEQGRKEKLTHEQHVAQAELPVSGIYDVIDTNDLGALGFEHVLCSRFEAVYDAIFQYLGSSSKACSTRIMLPTTSHPAVGKSGKRDFATASNMHNFLLRHVCLYDEALPLGFVSVNMELSVMQVPAELLALHVYNIGYQSDSNVPFIHIHF